VKRTGQTVKKTAPFYLLIKTRKMSKEKKIYTYGCNDCEETYEFEHPQTYKNCNNCEWMGELRLHSIEVIDEEVGDE
tara:strand:- start:1470 stop:1700 length:231 start_codon:yes stop_codon:yes gene_type:complete